MTIAIIVDLLGTVVMIGVALAIGERFPNPTTLLLAAVAGTFAVAGILGLYTGLSVGRMGVVAPVTGVLAAVLPVVVGLVSQGWPGPAVAIGIALALVAVVLVSASASSDATERRSGIEYGLLGGIGLGFFNVAVGAFPEHLVAWPLVVIKVFSLMPIALIVVLGRRDWRIPAAILPIVVLGAFADLAGNGLYILATQAGRRDVAAMLSSLYPVTTVVLAVFLLHERVTRSHLVGIVTAGIGVALIALGSTSPAL